MFKEMIETIKFYGFFALLIAGMFAMFAICALFAINEMYWACAIEFVALCVLAVYIENKNNKEEN